MSPRPSAAPVIAIVVSLIVVALSGPMVIGAIWADYALDYHGTCGPHPTDIPEHPCPFDQYAIEFFSPFAMIGIGLFTCAGWIGGGALVAGLWAGWALVRALRGPRREVAGRG